MPQVALAAGASRAARRAVAGAIGMRRLWTRCPLARDRRLSGRRRAVESRGILRHGKEFEAVCAVVPCMAPGRMPRLRQAQAPVRPVPAPVRGGPDADQSGRCEPLVTGMFIWPQIDDQRQRSLVTAGAQTTNTSDAVYVLTAVSAWPGVATRRFRGPSRSVTRCAGRGGRVRTCRLRAIRLRTSGPASEMQIALFWAAWTRHAIGLARLGAGLPAAPAARADDGFAVREAGHSRKGMEHHRRGWNRTVRVSRCSDRVRDHGSEQRFNATVAGLARRGPASHLAGRRDPDSKPSHGSMVGLSFLFRELNVAGQGCACAAAGPRRWVVTGRDFWLACAGPSASTTVGLRRESGVRRSSIEPARQDHQRMCSPARPGGDQDDY
jgi:hypothetical protein